MLTKAQLAALKAIETGKFILGSDTTNDNAKYYLKQVDRLITKYDLLKADDEAVRQELVNIYEMLMKSKTYMHYELAAEFGQRYGL